VWVALYRIIIKEGGCFAIGNAIHREDAKNAKNTKIQIKKRKYSKRLEK